MRKIFLVTEENGTKYAYSSFNSFVNNYSKLEFEEKMDLPFRGNKRFEMAEFKREEYVYKRGNVKVELVPLEFNSWGNI
jgi:hypothetical protein